MFQICRRVFSIIVIIQLLHHETLYVMTSQIQIERCPTMCICDIYKESNRANCSGQHLISGYIGISSSVEWLDLSNNDITTIDNQCFYEFSRLNTLLLDRNSISFIDLDGFVTLTRLKSISLANNRLESFDNQIFEENQQLTNVDLSVNKFLHLPNEPILKSKSLQTLDLHKSFLTHLHVKYFEELPNVRSIDLSGNLLIVLNLAAFAVNNRLQELNINENRMKCDAQMDMSIVWLRRNNIRVKGDTCSKEPANISPTPSPILFERMQALPNPMENGRSTNISTMNATQTPIDLNSVWKIRKYSTNAPILDEECKENEVNTNACHLFQMCASNLTFLIITMDQKIKSKHQNPNDMNTNYNLLNSHHTWSEFITVQVAFYGGLFLGAMLGAIALFAMKLILDCVRMSKCGCASNKQKGNRHHHSYKSEIRCNDAECLNGSIGNNINQNQLISRINHENDENARRQRSSTSIFAILYERPVRRRYYRQFNRNATNLVRRLSQSRLFLNSSRAQNATNRNTRSHSDNNNNNNIQTNIVQASESNRQNRLNQVETENDIEFVWDGNDAQEIMLPMTETQLYNNDSISVHSLNIIIHDNNNIERENQLNLNRRTFAASETDIRRQCVERIETPPPPYDIVAE